nr:hypothetical protein [Tanacetum cinerariifolium]
MDQNTDSSGFDQSQPPQLSSKEISNDELKIMMQSYFERMNQSREQDKLLAEQELRQQEQAAQEKEGPPQDSDIRQLITEECYTKNCRKQKKNMEETMLELVEVCRQKKLYRMHDNVDDRIESALNSTLLLINLNSQRLDKKRHEVKNVVEQPTKGGTQPEYSFSMRYEHFITTPAMKLDEVAESSAKNLVPIPSEYEVTSDNESESNEPIKDDSFSAFTTFTNPLFNYKNDFTIHDEDVPIEESKVYSNPLFDDDEIYSDELESHVNSNFVESLSNHDTIKFDHLKEFSRTLMPIHIAEEERIRKEHAEYISLMERLITINPCPCPMVNANTIVESLPSSLIPVQDNDSQREEIDIVTNTDELLPSGFENNDSEGEIDVVEELRVDNSISNFENELADFNQDDPLFPRPPPEPPDDEFDFELNSREVISAVINDNDELECLDPRDEIDVSTNDEDDDYFPFMFVIRFFLPYLIYSEVFPFLLSAENEDTIFDPGISV